ncbi:MAG: peptide chain release factor N(5)-glutamine methyltransferase [Candidatus Eisenbacteria bacterium]
MNLSSLLRSVRQSLEVAGVPSPGVDAELLLSHVLKIPRSGIYLEPQRELSPTEETIVLDLARKRATRVPLQYITGECEFMSLTFKMKEGVFIPRPETEVLVDTMIERIEMDSLEPHLMLDLGTGSGAIAVSLAHHFRAGLVIASDISPLAVEIARENAILNGVNDITRFVVGSGLSPLGGFSGRDRDDGFDAIACNPPYVGRAEIENLEPEIRDHEPRIALDGGDTGLEFIESMLPRIASILTRRGIVGVEIGETQAGAVAETFESVGLQGIEVIKDLNGKDRVVIGRQS